MYKLNLMVSCNCGWYGYENDLRWFPFNPTDEFLLEDQREKPNNVIIFKKICPDCNESEHLNTEKIDLPN